MAVDLDIAYVARLARLKLTDDETKLFQNQLGQILNYSERLQQVDVSAVETAAHTSPIFNVFRAVEVHDWFSAEEALSNAPRQANDLFVVPKVLE